MTEKKKIIQFNKLLKSPIPKLVRSGRWLTNYLSYAIKHHPSKKEIITRIFEISAEVLLDMEKDALLDRNILSVLVTLPETKWNTFLDNLKTSNNENSLIMELLKILLQALILKESISKQFWAPVYNNVSEKLLLPIETNFSELGVDVSNGWKQTRKNVTNFLQIVTTKPVNDIMPTILPAATMSSLIGKWEKEVMPTVTLKTLKIKLYPTFDQKLILDKFIHTFRHVYNKTVSCINKGEEANFMNLRNKLVTEDSKIELDQYKAFDEEITELKRRKGKTRAINEKTRIQQEINIVIQRRRDAVKGIEPTKNALMQAFETKTPKEIRSQAVQRCCDSYKSAMTNYERGNIKFFELKHKYKTDKSQTIELTPSCIKIKNSNIIILPTFFEDNSILKIDKHNKRKIRNLRIDNNVDIVKTNNEYYLHMCVSTVQKPEKTLNTVAGVDLGIRSFATVHSSKMSDGEPTVTEYKHKASLIKKLNEKINMLKNLRKTKKQKLLSYKEKMYKKHADNPDLLLMVDKLLHILKDIKRIKKKQITKLEKRKADLIDNLHWDFINDLLLHNDVIYIGDIKSHDMVKDSYNKHLNVSFNDLKFFQLKQRLIYKAFVESKKVIYVPEHYTTKTCSSCGEPNKDIGSKKVFDCPSCNLITGRDINAAKNMKLKGMLN